jgi:tetraacyldisaccharide 4'-kinase
VSRSARPWLAPLVPLYRLAIFARALGLRTGIESTRRLRWPVVSIGSLSAGGAGKTPLTLALAQALTRRGLYVDILSRGYGRRRSEPARVDPNGSAEDFGDEPLLLARAANLPVFVAARRYDAGLLAEREAESAARSAGRDFSPGKRQAEWNGASDPAKNLTGIHLLDDGFQHAQLHRDADIVLVSAGDLNDKLLPAGNLREPIKALHRATILAMPAEDGEIQSVLASRFGWRGPVWRLHRRMEIRPVEGPAIAFCGIARPDQFFEGLEKAGLTLAAQIAFPDHHAYTQADLDRLLQAARSTNAAAFMTTEKDGVRLGPLAQQLESAAPLCAAQLRIEIEDEGADLDSLTSLLFGPAK